MQFYALTWEKVCFAPYLKQDINLIESVQRRFTKRFPGFGKYTYSKRLEFLDLPSLELRRLHFDLVWAYKIIFGHVDIRSDDFFKSRSTETTKAILISFSNVSVRAPSGPHFLRNESLICGIVCRVTLLIFRHILLLSAQLNVLIKRVDLNDFLNFT